MTILGYTPAQIRKALIAVAGFVGTVLTLALAQGDVIPEGAVKWATLVLSTLTAVGVFAAPNAPTKLGDPVTIDPSEVWRG